MIVMAIDQSSTCSGIVIAEYSLEDDDWKVTEYLNYSPKGKTFDERMINLCDYIQSKLEQIKVDVLVIEDVYKLRNTNTLIKLSNLQGALKELANVCEVKIEVVHPSQWRKILNTKHKHREQLKTDSKQFVFDKFGLEVNDDLADAFCILTYYFENIFKENE